jgi:hypothetical protein
MKGWITTMTNQTNTNIENKEEGRVKNIINRLKKQIDLDFKYECEHLVSVKIGDKKCFATYRDENDELLLDEYQINTIKKIMEREAIN